MSVYIRIYKATLHLYPAMFRHEYETEMVQLFSDLLNETTSIGQRIALLTSTISEMLKWAPPEIAAHAESSVASTPRFIKTNTYLSLLCVAPFIFASLYNLHTLYDHEAKPALLSLLLHMQMIYEGLFPALGLAIVVATIIWSLVRSERYWSISWLTRLQSAWHNSLLILGFIGVLFLAILR
jgi:hypothetical protein